MDRFRAARAELLPGHVQAQPQDEEMEQRGGGDAERDQRAVKPGYESDEEPGTRHQQSHRTATPQPGASQPQQVLTRSSLALSSVGVELTAQPLAQSFDRDARAHKLTV